MNEAELGSSISSPEPLPASNENVSSQKSAVAGHGCLVKINRTRI